MLVISGLRVLAGFLCPWLFQSRNRDACHFRKRDRRRGRIHRVMFQSRNRDACHFRKGRRKAARRFSNVSISQSRCLSFQVGAGWGDRPAQSCVSISQSRCLSFQVPDASEIANVGVGRFQSRNRDACHFRLKAVVMSRFLPFRFNLAIEMLVISGNISASPRASSIMFQSRNRDACHFRARADCQAVPVDLRFNLAIEMLVISGMPWLPLGGMSTGVSISQSRCLSFQVSSHVSCGWVWRFQSRNRDACHFRAPQKTR